ncbi:MAG TPA: hypothetical protein VF544_11640 [Pyrinomonadaceae bacterium]|jgi:hypothetical protein
MIFLIDGKNYRGESALEIVQALEQDATDYPYRGRPISQFMLWSLNQLGDRVPPRELDLSDRLEDEALALSYLCLRDEYGAGELFVDHPDSRV